MIWCDKSKSFPRADSPPFPDLSRFSIGAKLWFDWCPKFLKGRWRTNPWLKAPTKFWCAFGRKNSGNIAPIYLRNGRLAKALALQICFFPKFLKVCSCFSPFLCHFLKSLHIKKWNSQENDKCTHEKKSKWDLSLFDLNEKFLLKRRKNNVTRLLMGVFAFCFKFQQWHESCHKHKHLASTFVGAFKLKQ